MAKTTAQRLRGLRFNAIELRELTGWNQTVIEDWLSLFDDLINIANEVDDKSSSVKEVFVIDSSPYTPTISDSELFIDTSSNDIYINLPVGEDGLSYRFINIGFSGNRVYIVPALSDTICGESGNQFLMDAEVIRITFKEGVGWY